MSLYAQDIFSRVEIILQDATNVRWTVEELLQWLNDAQRQIVLVKPDANPLVAASQLAAGTKQTIPTAGTQFIDCVRNMGANGTTPGNAITFIPRKILDEQMPGCHSVAAQAVTQHYTFDSRNPKVFYVYPPATGSTYVELHYAAVPDPILLEGIASTPLPLGDISANPSIEWSLFRAYSKDADYAANEQRAAGALARFYQALGLKSSGEDAFDPDKGWNARLVASN